MFHTLDAALPQSRVVATTTKRCRTCDEVGRSEVWLRRSGCATKLAELGDAWTLTLNPEPERPQNHPTSLTYPKQPFTAKVNQRAWAATGGKLRRRALLLQRRGHRHNCQRHALSKMWTKVLGPKTWGTCSEVTSRTAVSAWQWLHVGRLKLTALAAAQGLPAPMLCDALMTRLLMEDMVVQSGDGRVWASLGNFSWSALLYPLEVVDERAGLRTLRWCGTGTQVEFAHVVDPRAWSALTCRSALAPAQGITLEEVEVPRPLLEWSLRYKTASLSLDLLKQLADFMQLEGVRRDTRKALLLALVACVFEGREEREEVERIIEQAATAAGAKKSASLLLMDPVFEAAWDEMPHDEQFEFPEVIE